MLAMSFMSLLLSFWPVSPAVVALLQDAQSLFHAKQKPQLVGWGFRRELLQMQGYAVDGPQSRKKRYADDSGLDSLASRWLRIGLRFCMA
jgi:hypothetical protein